MRALEMLLDDVHVDGCDHDDVHVDGHEENDDAFVEENDDALVEENDGVLDDDALEEKDDVDDDALEEKDAHPHADIAIPPSHCGSAFVQSKALARRPGLGASHSALHVCMPQV